jgi:hypothetical protein
MFKATILAGITVLTTLVGTGQASAYTIGGSANTSSNVAVGPFPAVCIDASVQEPLDFGGGFINPGRLLIRFGNPASTNNQFGQLGYTANTSDGPTYYQNSTDTAPLQACANTGTTVTSISWTAPNAAGIALTGTSGAMTIAIDYTDSSNAAFTCTVGWPGGLGTDLTSVCVAADSTAPSVTLSSTTTTLTGTAPFTVTATFDEDVTGFDDLANDITSANGTVTGITAVSAAVYTLTVTPTGAGDVSITVPAAAAQDAAANDNTASNTLVIGNTVEITQKAIAGFMLGRANNLASNQPGLKRFLPGTFQNTFDAAVTRGNGTLSGAFAQGNTWAELTGSWSGDDNYALGSFGAHSFVNPNLLIGGMLQFDYAEDSANNASGNGYMVGPYFVAQVPDQPLFLEGRLLYGQTDNKISPLGTYTDSFETERWLAQVRATGEYQYMATTLMPLLDLTYTDDSQKAYTDSLGNVIPGQTVSLMQISVGVDFSTPISVDTGALELTGGLSGIYSSTDGGAAAPEFENWRGRTHLGLNHTMENGANLSATAFYDGIGSDHEAYGTSLGFDQKF